MIVQGTLVKPIAARFGERQALLTGLLCGAVGFAIYGLAPTGTIYYLGIPIMAFWGLAGPSAQALMTRRVGPSEQGQLQGAIASLMGIAGLIGPVLFTETFALFIGPWRRLAHSGRAVSPGIVAVADGGGAGLAGDGKEQGLLHHS